MQPLLVILICLILAYIFSELFKLVGLPRVVGQISAGILLSIFAVKYSILDTETSGLLSFLANLGIILLFYYAGLQINLKSFSKNIKKSVWISIFNTTLPLIAGYVLMRFIFGFDSLSSIIVGVSLAVSAQSVSVDILEELKILKSKIGSIVLSAGAVDDIIELLIVSVLLSSFHFLSNDKTVAKLIFDVLIFVLFIILVRVWFIPLTLKFFDREKSSTSRFMGSMIIVILIAYFSEFLGIGAMIGAMIAGILVRQTIFKEVDIPNWEEHDIARSTHIIAFGFLIPLFFVWVGLNTNIANIGQNIGLILLFVLIAVVCTVLGTMLAIVFNRGSFKEGLVVGWGLTPKGDVELVIIALALKSAIISQQIFTSLVVMSVITTILAPIIFKSLVRKYYIKARKNKDSK